MVVRDRQPLGEPHHGVLGCRVCDVAVAGEDPRHRRRVYQVTTTAGEHAREHCSDCVDVSHDIDRPLLIPDLGRGGEDVPAVCDAGVAEAEVDRTETRLDVRDHRAHRILVAHIGRDGDAVDLVRDGPAALAVAVDDRDMCTGCRKRPARRGADAARATGDHRDLAAQLDGRAPWRQDTALVLTAARTRGAACASRRARSRSFPCP